MRLSLFVALLLPVSTAAIALDSLAPKPWKEFIGQLRTDMKAVDSLGDLSVPLLQPVASIRKWGKPQLNRSADGGYWIFYSNPDPKKPFERIMILASPKPIPNLSSVPEEEEVAEVNGTLGVVMKPQRGKTVAVKWKTPEGRKAMTLRYFRESSGGGADGPLDTTDAFSLTSGGKTGYYVISVESVTGATESRLGMLEVAP